MEHLPLYRFFEKLRKNESFWVGVADYATLLEVMMHWVDTQPTPLPPSKEKLLEFCKMLWLKPGQNKGLFEAMYEACWQVGEDNATTKQESTQKKGEPSNQQKPKQSKMTGLDASQFIKNKDKQGFKHQRIYLNFDQQSGLSKEQPHRDKKHFYFAPHYIPYKKRDIAQVWRSFNPTQTRVPSDQIDIVASVEQKCRQGFLSQLVYHTQKQGKARLITLIEHKGGMVAFKNFALAIAQSAREFADIENEIYFFHHAPHFLPDVQDYCLYLNEQETAYQTLGNLLQQFSQTPPVLIISDAGATTNAIDPERITQTELFLGQLGNFSHKVAWLNPMPEDRWANTSAALIKQLVPSFEANLLGLKKALNILKGHAHDSR